MKKRKKQTSQDAGATETGATATDSTAKRSLLRIGRTGLLVVGMILGTAIIGGLVFADWWTVLPDDATASYVGRDSCIQCHTAEHAAWVGSHHDLAMDLATEETVLADFDDAEIDVFGKTSKMFRRDGKFMINTEGPDGKPTDFEIKYVFGVDPLQQYMVEFDRPADMPEDEVARVQVLRIAWDTQQKKWFYLPPPDVKDEPLDPSDDLHWTGVAQRWNNMCADCHSTNLKKQYDVKTATYHTTFSEIDVSCEACHGPGSLHVKLANSKSFFWDRKLGYGLAKLKGKDSHPQIETCAHCHSRRRLLDDDYEPGAEMYDFFANELLGRQTYFCDGQIMDEVYVHGSFTQSKMYHKGIRCTDCHDPHSLQLKYNDNRLCTSCHQHSPGKYDGAIRHHHKDGSTGASCVECHMPETTYMEVDPRRDHSLRVPRPDLSVALGTPNACTRCHLNDPNPKKPKRDQFVDYAEWVRAAQNGDQEVADYLSELDQWAADKTREWYGEKPDREQHFAYTIAAARDGEPAAEDALIQLAKQNKLPSIVRATALAELAQFDSDATVQTALDSLEDKDPQIRAAAIPNLAGLTNEKLLRVLTPLLDDPVRLVRTEAARMLARIPDAEVRGRVSNKVEAALEEYKKGLMLSSDRAAAHLTIAVLYETQGRRDDAIRAYKTAIRVEPTVTGPRTNLAALYDRMADEKEQEMRQAITRSQQIRVQMRNVTDTAQRDQMVAAEREQGMKAAEAAGKYRALADQYRQQELPNLARDARLAPEAAMIQYRYGLALYLRGALVEAEAALKRAAELEPNTPDFALALTLLYQKQQRFDEAIERCDDLLRLRPEDRSYQQLRQTLQAQQAQPKQPTGQPGGN